MTRTRIPIPTLYTGTSWTLSPLPRKGIRDFRMNPASRMVWALVLEGSQGVYVPLLALLKNNQGFHTQPSALQQIQGARADSQLRPRKRSKKILAVLIGIVGLASVIGALSAWSYSAPSYSVTGGNKHITMDHVFNGTFAARSKRIDWVKEGECGVMCFLVMHREQDMSALA